MKCVHLTSDYIVISDLFWVTGGLKKAVYNRFLIPRVGLVCRS